jgi:ArsR family transcriptional regulator, arsenate/arsenite/antimonite-responsive transcriptional repressor
LTRGLYFHIIGNVKTIDVVRAFGALAQETRLGIYRLLVAAGPEGLAAGVIAGKRDLPPATLSFHLKELNLAGLARSRQEGRFVIYSANFDTMIQLVSFLTENCCGGKSCVPAFLPAPTAKRKKAA